MPTAVPYSVLKESNVREKRFISIHLSNQLLAEPIPLRCMFCGQFLNVATHYMPISVVDAKINTEDCNPIIDVRCKDCKLNWRIYK